MTEPDALAWYVLRTHRGKEEDVAERCEARGFPALLPRFIERGRVKSLFGPYVFAAVDRAENWHPLRTIRGSVTLLVSGAGLQPARVPNEAIADIRSRIGADGYVELAKDDGYPVFEDGQAVRVKIGRFTSYPGFYVKRKGMRERVLLSILGGVREVTLQVGCLEALDIPKI